MFDMGKSSLYVSFYCVIRALNAIAPDIIKWPDAQRRIVNEEKFRRMGHIRGVIGAVDGTYVPIKAPSETPQVYINRKCFHGITLQAVADPELRFINTFVGFPSSVSDIRIFHNSNIYREMCNSYSKYFSNGQFIIGDKAYPCTKFCIPPYIERWNVTEKQLNFNTYQAKMRQVVERSFAMLFGGFRRLKYLDMNRTDLIPFTITSSCVLHNLCIDNNDLGTICENEGQG